MENFKHILCTKLEPTDIKEDSENIKIVMYEGTASTGDNIELVISYHDFFEDNPTIKDFMPKYLHELISNSLNQDNTSDYLLTLTIYKTINNKQQIVFSETFNN